MDNVPIHLGPYKVGKTLGIGAFGKVKLGEHLVTGQRVAVKILNKGKIKHMEMSEKVRREINILNMCTHPHVIRLYEVIDTPTDIFVVTEYASGGELFDYIVSKGRLPPDEARQIFHQLISCMEYCHYHKIVHRDLKPENLLLDHDNNIKLADFGLSNVIHDGDFLRTSCGSPNYAAPEVISGNLYAGPEVDVWSCGVILYALLCGTLPFDDESIPNLFKKIKSGMYTLPPHLPPPAKELIMRMLVVDPIKRLTIADVRAHPWFQQKLPTYMNMLPHEIDMQRQFIDDEIVSMVCQLNIPGVTPELVVTAVQEHNSLNITVGGTGSGTSISRANLAAAANESSAPPAAPAPAAASTSAIVMINNNNNNAVPGAVATPAVPGAGAGAVAGAGSGGDGIATFSTASLARFKHDVRVAYELLLDAKRHKQRLADVMNVLQEINASRSSPGSSFASSPKIGSYMGAVSPTSQITIKLDMVMREGSGGVGYGSLDNRSRQNSGTGGGVNHLLGNINTAIGAAAAANSASGQHHFGSAAVPSASAAASGAGGISGSLAAAAAASTSTASTATASSGGTAAASSGSSAVTDPNAAKRRRWYLGIQSKKDPGHVMTEVYKALLALGCRWHAMNNYRVLCAWRHAPEPPKRTTLNMSLSPFMQPHALAHSIVHTNSYKHRQMVASMAAANLSGSNSRASSGSGGPGAGAGSGGGGADGSQQTGRNSNSSGGSTTRRSLTGKRHHRSRRSGNDDDDDSGGGDTPASDSDSDGDGRDADDSRMLDDDGIFEMQADDDVMAQTPPPPSGGGSGPGGRRIVSISQNHHGGAGRNNNMNNSSSMGTSGLGGEFAAMDMEGGGGGGSGGGLMGFRPPGAPGAGFGGGGMNSVSVLQPTHGGLGNLGGVHATPVTGKGLMTNQSNPPQGHQHAPVSVPIPAAVLADPSAFEEMVCNRQHEKRLLHWLRTVPQDPSAAAGAGGNRGPALGAPVPGSYHAANADGEYFVSHANPSPQLIKAALSLFKVQQNIYLLDFQRVEGDAFGFMKLCALIVAELKNLSSSSRSSGSSGHSSSSSSSGHHHQQQQQHGSSGGSSMPPQPPTSRSSSGNAAAVPSPNKR